MVAHLWPEFLVQDNNVLTLNGSFFLTYDTTEFKIFFYIQIQEQTTFYLIIWTIVLLLFIKFKKITWRDPLPMFVFGNF